MSVVSLKPQSMPIDGVTPLNKIDALLKKANARGLSYCHWKTNLDIDKAFLGIDDLDLLVAERDYSEFEMTLLELGFRQAHSITSPYQPGIFHFLANDDTTGKLLNAHVHIHTFTGDHFIKSWALPFEDMLLSETITVKGMPLPGKEAELIIYVVRSMIKHASLFDFLLLRRSNKGTSREYCYLTADIDTDKVEKLLQSYLPEIDSVLFTRALVLLARDDMFAPRVLLGRKFKRKLKKYRRFTATRQTFITTTSIARMSWNRLVNKHKHMRFETGGKVIALIGPQATGKSTIAAELKAWLGCELAVRTIHAGKPPRTLFTFLPSLLIPVARKLLPGKATVKIEKDAIDNDSQQFPLIFIVRKVMLAWDRKVLLQRAWRQARNGKVILSDRYPSDLVGAIDGATFRDDAIEAQKSPIKRYLMTLERKIYRQINPPDLVLSLTVSTEKAIERNLKRNKKGPKQTTAYVKLRHSMKYKPVFNRCPVISISTDEDFDQTITTIKENVWPIF